jgi:hypothetical protein
MAFNLPPDLTDELAAVNVLLSAIGESPVSTIEGEAPEAVAAQNLLREISLAVQSKGWPWNRDYQVALTPDVTGRCPLPASALKLAGAYPGPHSGSLVERKRFVYDNLNHSYVFEDSIIVDLVTKLAFEDMPEAARRYITIRAAQQFQGRVQTSLAVDRILNSEVTDALATLEEEVDEAEPHNQLTGNVQAYLRTHGRARRRS